MLRTVGVDNIGIIPTNQCGSSPAAAAGWWTLGGAPNPWAVYTPADAPDLASSYIDVSGSGNNAGVGVAPAFGGGWIFNGVNQYLTTTFIPDLLQDQAVIIQFDSCVAVGGRSLVGCIGTAGTFDLRSNPTIPIISYSNGAVASTLGLNIASAVFAIGSNRAYRNGVDEGIALGAWGVGTIFALYVGARNNFGVGATGYAAYRLKRIAIYDQSAGHAIWVPIISNALALLP